MRRALFALVLLVACAQPAPPQSHSFKLARGAPTAAWSVPNWWVDPANSTGCAADTNSCTTAICGTVGVGPCRTISQIVDQRWQTDEPILPQTTTITLLSSETTNQEQVSLRPLNVAGTVFALVGAPKLVANVTLGAVTAKNRATATLLQAAGFSAVGLAAGQLVINATHPSHAWIEGLVGNVATLSQPLAPLTIANALTVPATPPAAEVDTWAASDSVAVYTLPAVNLKDYQPDGGDGAASFNAGTSWMQYIDVIDVSGVDGTSVFSPGAWASIAWIADTFVSPYVSLVQPSWGSAEGKMLVNDYLDGGAAMAFACIVGGVIQQGVQLYGGEANMDGGVVSTGMINVLNGTNFFGDVYNGSSSSRVHQARVEGHSIIGYTPFMWGPGAFDVTDTGTFHIGDSGGTWVQTYLSPTLTIDGGNTATKYASGVWTDGVSVTPANIDTFHGLQHPNTGSRCY